MGVAIDKSRGNTVVERVSIKSVTEGGSAALAKSSRGVGLKLGMYNAVDMILVYPKAWLATGLQHHVVVESKNVIPMAEVLLRCSFWQTCSTLLQLIPETVCGNYSPGIEKISNSPSIISQPPPPPLQS